MDMLFVANTATCLVAAAHVFAGYKEMTDWPRLAKKLAGIDISHGEATKVVGWNQGLYNLLFAAGLLIGVFLLDGAEAATLKFFCLGALAVAGLGAFYSMKSLPLLGMQTGLSGLAMFLLFLS